jgi:hypothetical protein
MNALDAGQKKGAPQARRSRFENNNRLWSYRWSSPASLPGIVSLLRLNRSGTVPKLRSIYPSIRKLRVSTRRCCVSRICRVRDSCRRIQANSRDHRSGRIGVISASTYQQIEHVVLNSTIRMNAAVVIGT